MLRIFLGNNSIFITSSNNPTKGEVLCNGKTVAKIDNPVNMGVLKQKILALVESAPIDYPRSENNSGIYNENENC